ncbi:phage tail protein I [Clostridium sp. C2-6-12]|uniref:phage tail protein I n=1 Tax=Clostridium sp. C2-6-12 TaxID=2698832 RepID=UPI00136CCD79|nr:phage tail protein I [Clostridium sp. C2-6-12]
MDLSNFNLLELQTAYLQQDPMIQALCEALTPHLEEINKLVEEVFIYGRIDELSEELIDELAWQFHVDFYDYTLPLDKKRALIKLSPKLHKIKGTPQAVSDAVSAIFGRTVLKEWFEYGGKPYFFGLDIDVTETGASKESIEKLDALINAYKNKRSWIEYINIFLTTKAKTIYNTVLLAGEKITVYPYTPKDIESKGKVNIAIGQNVGIENVTLYPLKEPVTDDRGNYITTDTGEIWTM